MIWETILGVGFDLAIGAADSLSKKQFDAFQHKMLKKHPNHSRMWIAEEKKRGGFLGLSSASRFVFLDKDGQACFIGENHSDSSRQHLKLYTPSGMLIGEIVETNKIKMPFGRTPVRLLVILHNKKIGVIESNPYNIKEYLKSEQIGCKVVKVGIGRSRITNFDNEILAEVTAQAFDFGNITFVDYAPAINDVLVALLVLAIKGQDKIKKRIQEKRSTWAGE